MIRTPLTLTELEQMLVLQVPLTWRDDLRYVCAIGCGRLCRASNEGIRADRTEAAPELPPRSDEEVVAGWTSCLSCGRERDVRGEHVSEVDELADRRSRRIYRPQQGLRVLPTVVVDLRAAYRATGAGDDADHQLVGAVVDQLRASGFAEMNVPEQILDALLVSARGGDTIGVRRAFRQFQAAGRFAGMAVLL